MNTLDTIIQSYLKSEKFIVNYETELERLAAKHYEQIESNTSNNIFTTAEAEKVYKLFKDMENCTDERVYIPVMWTHCSCNEDPPLREQ